MAAQTWMASPSPADRRGRAPVAARTSESSLHRRHDASAMQAVTVSIADPARAGSRLCRHHDRRSTSRSTTARIGSRCSSNMPAVAINDLDIRGNDLVAATQGRSIWILDDISPLRQSSATTASAAARCCSSRRMPSLTPVQTRVGVDFVHLDYYLGASATGDVTLEVLDATGRVVHRDQSAPPDATDRWLPVTRPLPASPGHHRVVWNLRLDPPPAPHHRFAQLARALFEDAPAEPDGPLVLAGSYRVRLTAGGRSTRSRSSFATIRRATAAELRRAAAVRFWR